MTGGEAITFKFLATGERLRRGEVFEGDLGGISDEGDGARSAAPLIVTSSDARARSDMTKKGGGQ